MWPRRPRFEGARWSPYLDMAVVLSLDMILPRRLPVFILN